MRSKGGRRGGPHPLSEEERVPATLPKDAALRTGKAVNDPPERSEGGPHRSDAPMPKGPPDRAAKEPSEGRQPPGDARRLMLEDGVPENDAPSQNDLDLDDNFGI